MFSQKLRQVLQSLNYADNQAFIVLNNLSIIKRIKGGGADIAYGAQGQNRTVDTRIFSPLLYRLSYLGPSGAAH